jgi:Flp pilus assembly protein TadG
VNADLRRDRGAAALELALLLPVLFAVLALTFPLGQAFIEKMRVGRAAGTAERFASAAPNTPAYGASGRRPSAGEVVKAANDAYVGDGGSLTGFNVQVSPGTRPGDVVAVHAEKQVDLGPLGSFLEVIKVIPSHTITVSATATGREE